MDRRESGGRRLPTARALTLAAAVLPAMLLVAGCGGPDPDGLPQAGAGVETESRAAATPTTEKASSSLDSDERVLADYQAYWDVVVDVYADGDFRSTRLREHATGVQLDFVRNDVLSNATRRRVARGRPKLFGAEVTSRDEGKATVEDCIDSNQWLFHDAQTGRLVDSPSGKRYRLTAKLRLEDRRWKVADVDYKEAQCGS